MGELLRVSCGSFGENNHVVNGFYCKMFLWDSEVTDSKRWRSNYLCLRVCKNSCMHMYMYMHVCAVCVVSLLLMAVVMGHRACVCASMTFPTIEFLSGLIFIWHKYHLPWPKFFDVFLHSILNFLTFIFNIRFEIQLYILWTFMYSTNVVLICFEWIRFIKKRVLLEMVRKWIFLVLADCTFDQCH